MFWPDNSPVPDQIPFLGSSSSSSSGPGLGSESRYAPRCGECVTCGGVLLLQRTGVLECRPQLTE